MSAKKKTTTKSTSKKARTTTTEKLRKEALTEISARIASDDAPATEGKKGRAKKPKPDKPKRVGALAAAARVLGEERKPLRSQELITMMAEKGYWSSPNGRTPAATLYAAMIREIKAKGKDARFKQVGPGQFSLAK